MKQLSILNLLLLLSYQSIGQAPDLCSATECQCFINTGDYYIKQKNYKKAIFNYLAAQDCNATLGPKIEEKLSKVFNTIEHQRKDAIKAKKETAKALAKVKKEQEQTKLALHKLEVEQVKNKKIINAFYFYDDKVALAYDGSTYGFINKEGEVVIEYNYKEALHFDYRGFAKVKRYNSKHYLLIDTTGKEYILAENLNQLTKETTALDLSSQNLVPSRRILKNNKLKALFLGRNKLTELPIEIGKPTQLETLYLGGNQLTQLPSEIGNLTQLKTLHLYGSQLTELPIEIGNLSQLIELNLGENELTILPNKIGNLSQLQVLYLSSNQLTELPSEITNLTELTELHLIGNQLTSLPKEIFNLVKLTEFHISSNKITILPKGIGNLSQLTKLNLANNKLTTLPKEIVKLKNLSTLYLKNNPIPKEDRASLEEKMPWCKFIWE